MTKRTNVPRPLRKSEFTIVFATNQATKGWTDLLATQRNAVVNAWEYLTSHPDEETTRNHKLKGELARVTHKGATYDRWQHELNNGARIWFYIDGRTVHLVDVHTNHPNQTK